MSHKRQTIPKGKFGMDLLFGKDSPIGKIGNMVSSWKNHWINYDPSKINPNDPAGMYNTNNWLWNYQKEAGKLYDASRDAFKNEKAIKTEGVNQLTSGMAGLYSGLNYLNSYQGPENYGMGNKLNSGIQYGQMGLNVTVPANKLLELENSGLLGGFTRQQFYSLPPEKQQEIVSMALSLAQYNNVNSFQNGGETEKLSKEFGLTDSSMMRRFGSVQVPNSKIVRWRSIDDAYNAINELLWSGKSRYYLPEMPIEDILRKYSNQEYGVDALHKKYATMKLKDLNTPELRNEFLRALYRKENGYNELYKFDDLMQRLKNKELEKQRMIENLRRSVTHIPMPIDNTRTYIVTEPRRFQEGGESTQTGYLDGSPTAYNPYNLISSQGQGFVPITMEGVSQDLIAIGQGGAHHGRIKLLKSTSKDLKSKPTNEAPANKQYGGLSGEDVIFRSDKVLELPLIKPILTVDKVLKNIDTQNNNDMNNPMFQLGGWLSSSIYYPRIYNDNYNILSYEYGGGDDPKITKGKPVDLTSRMIKAQMEDGFADGIDLTNLTDDDYKKLVPLYVEYHNNKYSKPIPKDAKIIEIITNPTTVTTNNIERRTLPPTFRYNVDPATGETFIYDNYDQQYDPTFNDDQLKAYRKELIAQGKRPKLMPGTFTKASGSNGTYIPERTIETRRRNAVPTRDVMDKKQYSGEAQRSYYDNIYRDSIPVLPPINPERPVLGDLYMNSLPYLFKNMVSKYQGYAPPEYQNFIPKDKMDYKLAEKFRNLIREKEQEQLPPFERSIIRSRNGSPYMIENIPYDPNAPIDNRFAPYNLPTDENTIEFFKKKIKEQEKKEASNKKSNSNKNNNWHSSKPPKRYNNGGIVNSFYV